MPLLSKKTAPKKAAEKTLFSSHWLYVLYLAGVSAIAIIVVSINAGMLITSAGKYLLITDQEYIMSDSVWEVKQCSEPRYIKDEAQEKTPEEIQECKVEAETRALAQRSINLKETFIESLAWAIVFGLLFMFHYPKFLAVRKEK